MEGENLPICYMTSICITCLCCLVLELLYLVGVPVLVLELVEFPLRSVFLAIAGQINGKLTQLVSSLRYG